MSAIERSTTMCKSMLTAHAGALRRMPAPLERCGASSAGGGVAAWAGVGGAAGGFGGAAAALAAPAVGLGAAGLAGVAAGAGDVLPVPDWI